MFALTPTELRIILLWCLGARPEIKLTRDELALKTKIEGWIMARAE